MSAVALTRERIIQLFQQLNDQLALSNTHGELYLVGGAVMCLTFQARASTQDLDGLFVPADVLRKAAARIAQIEKLPPQWLNDGVKGYLSERGEFAPYLQLSHLKVMVAQPAYLLAMKCLSMRLGAEFHDEDDVRFLLRWLNIDDYPGALDTIGRYYPLDRFPQKALYALEELLPKSSTQI